MSLSTGSKENSRRRRRSCPAVSTSAPRAAAAANIAASVGSPCASPPSSEAVLQAAMVSASAPSAVRGDAGAPGRSGPPAPSLSPGTARGLGSGG